MAIAHAFVNPQGFCRKNAPSCGVNWGLAVVPARSVPVVRWVRCKAAVEHARIIPPLSYPTGIPLAAPWQRIRSEERERHRRWDGDRHMAFPVSTHSPVVRCVPGGRSEGSRRAKTWEELTAGRIGVKRSESLPPSISRILTDRSFAYRWCWRTGLLRPVYLRAVDQRHEPPISDPFRDKGRAWRPRSKHCWKRSILSTMPRMRSTEIVILRDGASKPIDPRRSKKMRELSERLAADPKDKQ